MAAEEALRTKRDLAVVPELYRSLQQQVRQDPAQPHDAHRALRSEEDLDLILTWRELRKVTQKLLHYERKLYLLVDSPDNRRLIGKYVEVFQYPDGPIEIRVAGRALPYSLYSLYSLYTHCGTIDQQGAIVQNKRLSHALQALKEAQARRVASRGCGRRLSLTVTPVRPPY